MCIVWLSLLFSEAVGVSCGCHCCSLRLLVCIVWLSLLFSEAVGVYRVAVTAVL